MAQIEFLSLKATTLVAGWPWVPLARITSLPFYDRGEEDEAQPVRGASRGGGIVGAGNEGSSLG